ncbi:WD40/YVTN/BNR-like repeat-containing protein [Trinickia violacea]|uniref:WD40/YVTN/BNR-like repeat-containing protein n=1 Tax=Trinickia violacea TaxID=2571746 RepID=UPI0020C7C75D|nr:YCF48-related protein [Trinickia violacea]
MLLLALLTPPVVQAFQGPADVPAVPSALSARVPLIAVTRAGQRIVAVGLRGDVVFSDDEGKTWAQASVPVSTDLVAVSFPTAKDGWAVGHGGVVIHSSDGGATWVKQMDGKQFSALALNYYQKATAEKPSANLTPIYEQAKALSSADSTRALLDVYFENDTSGFVVGAFNRIFHTEDGGKTWTPWMDRTNNPHELHFYSVHGGGGRILLTGEQGMVWELNRAQQVFEPKPTPYKGTLFGSVEAGNNLYVFGMRGSLFRSSDDGKTWVRIDVPSLAGVTGGIALADDGVLLVNQAGIALLSHDGGKSFQSVKLVRPMSYFGIGAASGSRVALVGSEGVRVEPLPQTSGHEVAAQH